MSKKMQLSASWMCWGSLILFLLLSSSGQAQLSVSISKVDLICFGLPTGQVEANSTGGTAPYAYSWSNGAEDAIVDRLLAGTYTVTVSDVLGDTATASVTLTQPTRLEVDLFTDECQLPTPISASPSGGTGGYAYRWTTGDTIQTIEVQETGQYCVTVTDENLCGRVACITINANPPSINLLINDISCPDDENGSIQAIVEGGEGNLTYAWSNGESTSAISDLTEGVYTLTVTDEDGCFDIASAVVDAPSPLSVTFEPVHPICPGDTTGSISGVVSGGTFPYTYLWNTGETSLSLSNIDAGTYILTVTDGNGCELIDSMLLVNDSNLEVTLDVRDETCPDQDDGLIIANVTGGVEPYTYVWTTGDTAASISDLAPGTYSVIITDAVGCVLVSEVDTVFPSLDFEIDIAVEPTTAPGASDGSATVTVVMGQGPFTFNWSTGDTTANISNLSAGNYSVTVTRADGCEATGAITILETDPLSGIIAAPENICPGDSSGTATITILGGTEPYQIEWSTGDTTGTIGNLVPGIYSVTVTDANEYQNTDSVTIEAFPDIQVTLDAPEFVCGGEALGTINVTVEGGVPEFTYEWSNGESSENLENLGSGTYSVTVTDANGCQAEATASIEIVEQIELEVTGRNLFCFGDNSGGASVMVTGGIAPYTYQWSNGDTTAQLIGLAAGMYVVTVTDSASCTATDSVLIAQPNEIIVEAEIEDLLCGEANTGSIILSATGGFPPFEYNWSNESDSPVLSDLDEGVYVVTVTDATGCFIVNSYDVANPGNPECNVNVTRVVSTPAAMDGEASVTVIGGVAPYTYEWGNGQTGVSADSLGVGDYSVTVTDAKGCSTSCSIAITPSSALLGDYVWLDEDYDGFQDTTEAGIPGIEVILTPLGECDTLPMDTTFTDETGFYSFVVEPCAYKLTFVVPDSLSITVPNNTQNRELDSDIDRLTAMTDTILIEAGETDYSWDAGLVPSPTSYFLDPCNCLNNATNDENGQFGDLFIVINGLPGDDWIITEIVNMFDVDSPEPPALPIPVLPGDTLQEFSFGEYRMPFRVVDNQPYSITVTNGIDTITEGGLCIYPDIEVVNIPSDTIDLCLTGGIFIPDLLPSIPGDLEILLDGVPINEVDPLQLGEGIYTLEVNLFPTDEAECIATTIRTIIIGTAGCPAKLGDFVWLDTNENGLQDAGEPGVSNVQVILQAPDGSPLDTTTTDNTGMYMFMVEAGEYKLTFDKLSNYEFTIPNAGDDLLDSDVDPATMMTLVVSLEEGEINNSLDAGFITPCINVTDPGEIGFDQMVCGPGNDPDALVSVRGASGGEGELEYLWMYSVETETFNMGLFTPIPNSNSETYDPGPLFETTWFARCARRVGCPGFLEPELVEITVKEDAIADITGPNVVCYTEEATYQVESKTGDPDDILWEFPLGVTSSSDSDDEVTLSFASFGQYTIQVSVTENGCTAIGTKKIVVTTNSDYCDGSDFGIEVSAVNQDKEVMVKWDMLDDSQRYIFDVEHAADGENYIVIAQVDEPNRIVDGVKYYEYMDLSPKVGRNYYRVKVANPNGEVSYSEAIELRLGQTEAKMLVYPNPAQESVTIEFLEEMPTRMEIELINANGKTLRSFLVGGETINQPIDLNGLPAGLYFLRVKMSREDTEVIKLWKAEE